MGCNAYIVEDMGVTRATLKKVLTENGHTIVGSAATAETAWLDIRELKPQIVILDFNLRGNKTGLWLAEKLREELGHNTAIIFLTAYGSPEILGKIARVEANGYLMKPFNNPTLLGTITAAMQQLKKVNNEVSSESGQAFVFKSKKDLHHLEVAQIFYLQSEKNYVHINTKDRCFSHRAKLEDLLQSINGKFIKRCHRRYALNVQNIEKIDGSNALLKNRVLVPLSSSYKQEIVDEFENNIDN